MLWLCFMCLCPLKPKNRKFVSNVIEGLFNSGASFAHLRHFSHLPVTGKGRGSQRPYFSFNITCHGHIDVESFLNELRMFFVVLFCMLSEVFTGKHIFVGTRGTWSLQGMCQTKVCPVNSRTPMFYIEAVHWSKNRACLHEHNCMSRDTGHIPEWLLIPAYIPTRMYLTVLQLWNDDACLDDINGSCDVFVGNIFSALLPALVMRGANQVALDAAKAVLLWRRYFPREKSHEIPWYLAWTMMEHI